MTGARPRPGGRSVAASRSWLGPLLAAGAVLAGAACAHPQRGPAEALADFGGAVDRKDYPAAYALMTAEYRRRVPLADFRRELEAGGPDVATVARRLRDQAASTPFEIEVEIDLGQKLTMVLEAGQWRVAAQPFDLSSQETPRAALRSFVRSVELRRYDALLRLIPNRYRIGVSVDQLRDYWEGERRAENQKLLQALRAHMNAPIVETGDEARMPYDETAEVRFLREDGVWKIEDVD
ncbi:MAG TPA: hypothetical protein VFH68_20500 [Polyangia bacterium]|jgi:hypothetical protein|nr:hypothetical protein [Polyangia bacterium]